MDNRHAFRDHVGDFIYGNASFYLSTFLDKYVGSFASYSILFATYAIALTIVYPKWIESIKSENLQKIVSKLKSYFKLSNTNIDDEEEGSIIPESSPIIEDEQEEENLEAIIDDFLDGPSEKETTSESLAEDTPKPEPVDTTAATSATADSSNEDGKDLDLEVKEKKEEDTVDENEIVQEYGDYDPTLELSKYQMLVLIT